AVRQPELTAQVAGRHVLAAGERLDVQGLGVLPVDAVADAAQPGELAQVLRPGGLAGHGTEGSRSSAIASRSARSTCSGHRRYAPAGSQPMRGAGSGDSTNPSFSAGDRACVQATNQRSVPGASSCGPDVPKDRSAASSTRTAVGR